MIDAEEIRRIIQQKGSGASFGNSRPKKKASRGSHQGKKKISGLEEAVVRMKEDNSNIADVSVLSGFTEAQLRSKARRMKYPSPTFGCLDPDKLTRAEKITWLRHNSISRLESPWVENELCRIFQDLITKKRFGIGYDAIAEISANKGLTAHISTISEAWKRVRPKRFPTIPVDIFTRLNR